MSKEREKWIDYTKVFACILVVIGHLLQGLNKAGIKWNNTFYDYIDTFIYLFHMPLFMCLSGYLYKKTASIKNWKDYVKFTLKKLINLGIPYIFFYILYLTINLVFSNEVNTVIGKTEFMNILTQPIAPYWFLYILIYIFIIIPLIEKLLKNKTKIVLMVTALIYIYNIIIPIKIYIINMIAQYMLYFYLGVFIFENGIKKVSIKKIAINVLIYIALSIWYFYFVIINNSINNSIIIGIFKTFMAFYGIMVCLNIFRYADLSKNKFWNTVSKYTFHIYLLHTFFTAAVRILLQKISIDNFYIHFMLGVTLGIIGPIIIGLILNKTKYGNIILFPIKTIKEIKKDENSNDRT